MTFDFEKFPVYKLALEFSKDIDSLLSDAELPKNSRLADQLTRAALSIALNIAEGAGRFHKADKKNFYITARGSVFECVAGLDILKSRQVLNGQQHDRLYTKLEEISKMLSGLINSQK
jgi:four helix bundle protein